MRRRLCGVVLLVLLSLAPVRAQTVPVTAPLTAGSWETVPLLPLTTTFDSVRVTIPDIRTGASLGYLITVPKIRPDDEGQGFWLQSVTNLTTLVVRWRITVTKGTPTFGYFYGPENPCLGPPAAAHVFLWQPGFDWYDELARWWGRGDYAVPLVPGYSTIRMPLTPDVWISVYGRQGSASDPEALAAFQRTLANPGSIGLTFGGGCYFGHGVTTTGGTATVELVDYHFESTAPPKTCLSLQSGVRGAAIPCRPN